MSSFPNSPRLIKGGLVLIDSQSGSIVRIIVLQYNPDTLTRSLQVQGIGPDSGDRVETLRLKGPPVETFKLEAEIDAIDQLEHPDKNQTTVQYGIQPQLATLETIVYPASTTIRTNQTLAQAGTLELIPAETPLVLFVWSRSRIVPVRLAEFSITEEAFDPNLNPLRAKVGLTLRVLSTNDLDQDHRGASLYMAYQQQKENFASMVQRGTLNQFGIEAL